MLAPITVRDILFPAGNFTILLAIAWKVNRMANRILDVLEDFPPHRHVNGKIIYPSDYKPPVVESMGVQGSS
jgi:hypothetical protein